MFRLTIIFWLAANISALAQPATLKVDYGTPRSEIQPTMWGVFFEDINFGADGGLYAELVKNRSFEFANPLMGWTVFESDKFSLNEKSGSILIVNRKEDNLPNPRFGRVSIHGTNDFRIANEGFSGIGIRKDAEYMFSIWMSQLEGSTTLRVELLNKEGKVIGSAGLAAQGKEWKKYQAVIKANATELNASLQIRFSGKSTVDVDNISLFPRDTWKQRPGGLRTDLIQLLADLKPGFLRFPGGCIVEGYDLNLRYQWKKTIGAPEERTLIKNRWNDEFKHRPAPDYFQSFGLGFFEYFQLAEDIGAAPLPILSCGMACQFNSAEVVPMAELDPYVQDALDLIEFANGGEQSRWGRLRSVMGHPAPFNLRMIGVGNEQWGPQYVERYKVFAQAIKSRYPEIRLVSGSGPFAEGEMFEYGSREFKTLKADIVDEHYYKKPEWFFSNAGRYDHYDRSGPKIFAGEYAAQSVGGGSPDNKNNWECALSEAAFMTGLERNADMVTMASYAPLFAHVDRWQWTPDLIWFDNLQSYGTPNYYVQKLFSVNKGTHTISVTINNKPVEGEKKLFASGVWDNNRKEVILKIVNSDSGPQTIQLQLNGKVSFKPEGKQTILASDDSDAVNSIANPRKISPEEKSITVKGRNLQIMLPARSLNVVKLSQ